MIRLKFKFVIGLIVAGNIVCSVKASEPIIIGDAYDIETSELLYRESHFIDETTKVHRVVYNDVLGEQIAVKQLDFRSGRLTPKVEQENFLCGELIIVAPDLKQNVTNITYQASTEDEQKHKTMSNLDNLVIDAGFNDYIQQHWESLIQGEVLEFYYLVPSRLRAYKFKTESVSCQTLAEATCFKISPNVWYLKILVDPIYLTYHQTSQRLMNFKGLGNIADEHDNYMTVDIHYRYPANQTIL